jgi:cytochrome P450
MAVLAHPAVTMLRGTAGRNGTRSRWRRRDRAQRPGLRVDPLSRRVIADPPATYRELHAHGGVHHCPHRDLWVLAGHDAVRDGARANAALSSAGGVSVLPASLPMMITSDRPEHTRLRRLVAPHFTRASAERLRPRMQEITDVGLNELLEAGGGDAVAALAVPLPVTVIAEVLGVPAADLPDLRRWSDGIVDGFHADVSLRTIPLSLRVGRDVLALHRYMRRAFARLREHPGDDVLSALLASCDEGNLTEEELFWFALMLLLAGNETTTNLIGSMLLALARDPDAYARLRADPNLIGGAVEEALRWASPIQGLFRTATEDCPVGGATVPRGARAILMFGAANRDPSVYPDPDRFVLDRPVDGHLAFGGGIHFCLGAHLARVEAAVVLERFAARVAHLELAGEPRWTRNPTVRGPAHLPLRLVAG